jgi:hypothetical protein
MNDMKVLPASDEPREPEESEGSTSNAPWLGCVVHVGSNYAVLRATAQPVEG